jgi:formylmethanofuran dehydrogenase subunit E
VTYRELYTEVLENMLRAGGTEAAMNKIFSEFDAPTAEGLERWLVDRDVHCGTCGKMLTAPKDVELDDEVVCQDH